jgi:aminoglycoside phosphotransferase (APT) family kinase protein
VELGGALAHAGVEQFVLVADAAALAFEPALIHADLGPEHLLCDDSGRLVGVIDWGDVAVGDPALDYAWLLHGAGVTLDVDDDLRRRALVYHRLAPWYDVAYGLDTGRGELVARGLARVRDRLT